ncbi:MAG: response regulator [Campylobacterota bacterium]|nr:response regulator [Campylobacterota bacterium]
MYNLDEVADKLTPLVKAYARDMRILIVEDQVTNINLYKILFGEYFSVCDTALNGQIALDKWNKNQTYYDLIVTDVDMPIMSGTQLVKEIRDISMEQSIIAITATTDVAKNQDLAYYFIDGILPKPVNKQKLFILLYRVLKKIAEKKEFSHYISDLEEQVDEAIEFRNHYNFIISKLQPIAKQKEAQDVIAMLNTLVGKTDIKIDEQKTKAAFCEKITQMSDEHEKDLRFSTTDNKLSSEEFLEQLDDSIVDKIENFLEVLDDLVSEIDILEREESAVGMNSLSQISSYLNEFIDIVNSLVIFPIVSRAFIKLNSFIGNITQEELANQEKKLLLVSLLLNLEKDISNWITNIFINTTAQNIYYFDASFSNGVFEIESMFNSVGEESSEEFSDDDLGFF